MTFLRYWLGILILMSWSAVSSCATTQATTQAQDATENVATLSKELRSAAYNGDIDKARLLLLKGADVNAADKDGTAPLHIAVREGNAVVMRQLIAIIGADINAADKSGMTPLHMAAQRGDWIVVDLLIAKGADIDATDKLGMTPQAIAIMHGKKDIPKSLHSMSMRNSKWRHRHRDDMEHKRSRREFIRQEERGPKIRD